MKMMALKFLGSMDRRKQSTCIRPDISPNLKFLLQRVEYLMALFTIPIETELDISVPRMLRL